MSSLPILALLLLGLMLVGLIVRIILNFYNSYRLEKELADILEDALNDTELSNNIMPPISSGLDYRNGY